MDTCKMILEVITHALESEELRLKPRSERTGSAAKCPPKDSEPFAASSIKTRYSPKNNATAAFSLTAS